MRKTGSAGRFFHIIACLAVISVGFSGSLAAQEAAGLEGTIEGVLSLIWGDGPPEAPQSIGPIPVVVDPSGGFVELLLEKEQVVPLGGLLTLNGRRVEVHGSWTSSAAALSANAVMTVSSIAIVDPEAPMAITAVSGSQPWVSIMCKFPDVSGETRDLAFFQGMYSSSYPGLDHYWRELSYENINVAGSSAHGWYTLPNNKEYYVPGGSADLNRLFDGCTGVAAGDVDFSDYVGINLMFNDLIGPYAWGGTRGTWRVTWEPPWGWGNVTVMSHEMGHGFGLPHSCYDDPSHSRYPYINEWDVMSDAWAPTLSDPTYGQIAQHTISHHKDHQLGWLRAPEKVKVNAGNSTTVVLERLARPTAPWLKMVKIPISGSVNNFYTVEARKRAGYDLGLTANAVIIHEVDTYRSIDAYVQGTDGGSGAMWTIGELFRDAANDIGVAVVSSVGNGFTVAAASGSPMAASFPKIDDRAASGTSSNTNGVFEPGETVIFEPEWTNVSTGTVSPTGSLGAFSGPGGASYTITDGGAGYGSVASVGTASCKDVPNCYRLAVSDPASRPSSHWDATVVESLSTGGTKTWTLHLGSSFADVDEATWAYPYIETIFHHNITTGWTATDFEPLRIVKRWHMATFLARGLIGSSTFPTTGTVPGRGNYNCISGGTSVFSDVGPATSMCSAVHYIASREVTVGCGGTRFCPYDNVSRWQMALFLARAMTGRLVFPTSGTVPGMGDFNCVDGGQSVFSDLSPTHSSCTAVHFLARFGVTEGCRSGEYCPWNSVNRAQMATFLTRAFGLGLYRP
jgi:hypothetical protein